MTTDERGYLFDLAGIRYIHDGDSSDEELPQRARLRFFGVTVADNPTALDGAGCLDITVTGGGEGGEPEGAAGGDLFGTYPDPFVKGYHPSAGGTQVLIGAHPVGSLLERTGTNTAAGSAYWFYGTTAPQGNISKTEGALYLKTDTHELYQNVSDGSGTDWERVWPLQIIDVTGGSPVAMPARPRIRFLSGTITDNSGQNSTDITPGGGAGRITIRIVEDFMGFGDSVFQIVPIAVGGGSPEVVAEDGVANHPGVIGFHTTSDEAEEASCLVLSRSSLVFNGSERFELTFRTPTAWSVDGGGGNDANRGMVAGFMTTSSGLSSITGIGGAFVHVGRDGTGDMEFRIKNTGAGTEDAVATLSTSAWYTVVITIDDSNTATATLFDAAGDQLATQTLDLDSGVWDQDYKVGVVAGEIAEAFTSTGVAAYVDRIEFSQVVIR